MLESSTLEFFKVPEVLKLKYFTHYKTHYNLFEKIHIMPIFLNSNNHLYFCKLELVIIDLAGFLNNLNIKGN